jgi:uncharacterized membrane protein
MLWYSVATPAINDATITREGRYMTWTTYLRRMAIELTIFFLICAVVFYLVTGRESWTTSVNTALLATFFYGLITFILRQRALRNQEQR